MNSKSYMYDEFYKYIFSVSSNILKYPPLKLITFNEHPSCIIYVIAIQRNTGCLQRTQIC